jgi:hypothetical protein
MHWSQRTLLAFESILIKLHERLAWILMFIRLYHQTSIITFFLFSDFLGWNIIRRTILHIFRLIVVTYVLMVFCHWSMRKHIVSVTDLTILSASYSLSFMPLAESRHALVFLRVVTVRSLWTWLVNLRHIGFLWFFYLSIFPVSWGPSSDLIVINYLSIHLLLILLCWTIK